MVRPRHRLDAARGPPLVALRPSRAARHPAGQLAQEVERDVQPIRERAMMAHGLLVALGKVLAGAPTVARLEPRAQLRYLALARLTAWARQISGRLAARARLLDGDDHLPGPRVVEG